MSSAIANLEQERLCPACGYDLRATTSGRCPECGAQVGQGSLSRIPWVHRRYVGMRWSFFSTIWMVMVHPARLAAEMRWPMNHRGARAFASEALALATVLTSAMFTLAFLVRGPRLERWVFPTPAWAGGPRGALVGPVYVLADGLWAVVPLLITTWLSLRITMSLFRWMLWHRARRRETPWSQRRAVVTSLYAAGMMPVAGLLGGAGLTAAVAVFDLALDVNRFWQGVLVASVILLPLAGLFAMVYPTAALLHGLGVGVVRAAAAGMAFALAQIAVWILVGAVVFWITGFLVVCVWSSLH